MTGAQSRARGFTLIESIVVLVVMSVLAILATQLFLSAAQHQQLASYQADFAQDTERALSMLRADLKNTSFQNTALPSPFTIDSAGVSGGSIVVPTLPGNPCTRGTRIVFYPIHDYSSAQNKYNFGSQVTYQFILSNNPPPAPPPSYGLIGPFATPTLIVQKAIANAFPAGNGYLTPGVSCELIRSVGGRGAVVAKMIRYWPGAPAPAAIEGTPYLPPPAAPSTPPPAPVPMPIAPYFELDTRNVTTPVLNVCFELMQAVKEEGQTNWAIYTRPVLASFRLQP